MADIESICKSVSELSIQPSTFDCFVKTIEMSEYVQSCVSKTTRDNASISSLIDRHLSQSDCIKIGIAIEDVLRLFIKTYIARVKDIKEKNTKDKKEKDHLFIDEENKVVYYAEIKANLNLDTEKYHATINKCKYIHEELTTKYPDHTINMYLVGARYLHASEMSSAIHKKYSDIQSSLIGVNDYLMNLGYTGEILSFSLYRELLNKMVNNMFDK
jgi:hypothetical protein